MKIPERPSGVHFPDLGSEDCSHDSVVASFFCRLCGARAWWCRCCGRLMGSDDCECDDSVSVSGNGGERDG